MGDSWNHWATIPSTVLLTFFLLGIEELGVQIEEPFGILPLEAFADGSIEGVVQDMRESYKKGLFGPTTPGSTLPCPANVKVVAATSTSRLEDAAFSDGKNEMAPGGYVVSDRAPRWMRSVLEDENTASRGGAQTPPFESTKPEDPPN